MVPVQEVGATSDVTLGEIVTEVMMVPANELRIDAITGASVMTVDGVWNTGTGSESDEEEDAESEDSGEEDEDE